VKGNKIIMNSEALVKVLKMNIALAVKHGIDLGFVDTDPRKFKLPANHPELSLGPSNACS
jgi:hypothetical protein